MTELRKEVIKNYLKFAKSKCPFTNKDLQNGYIEGFLDCAEMFEKEFEFNEKVEKYTLNDYEKYQMAEQQTYDDMNTWR